MTTLEMAMYCKALNEAVRKDDGLVNIEPYFGGYVCLAPERFFTEFKEGYTERDENDFVEYRVIGPLGVAFTCVRKKGEKE